MNRSRALIAMLLALIVALATACDTGGGDDGEEAAEPETAAEEGGTEELSGDLTVRFMGDPQDIQQTLADEFAEANPGVNVEVQNLPWDGGHDVFTTEIAGGDTVDVSEVGNTWTREFADLGGLEPIDDIEIGEVPEGLREQGVLDDTLYGAFWFGGARALIYRADLFEQAGITEPPQTWDDVMAACETIKSQLGPDVFAISLAGGDMHSITPLIWNFGGEVATEEGGELQSTVNSPEAAEAWNFYKQMYDAGCSPEGAVTWNSLEAREPFAAGQTAMFIGGGWDVFAMINDDPSMEEKLGVALLPEGPGGNRDTFAGGSHLAVFEGSDNKPAAKAFVEFMMQPDVVGRYVENVQGFFPGTADGIQQTADALGPLYGPFAEMLSEHTRSYPLGAAWGAIEGAQVFQNALQSILTGQASTEDALASLEEQMNAEF